MAPHSSTAMNMASTMTSIIAPRDGTYIIQIRESSYRGSDNCFYPDSGKWAMDFRKHDGIFRRVEAEYFDGEE